ncbi:MAG: hypothetical protein ACRDBG_03820, partial [Waterburya sp.]
VQVFINNTLVITAPTDPALTGGKVGYKTVGSTVDVSYYQVDVGGDTSSAQSSTGQAKFGQTIGNSVYSLALHEYFWGKIVELFDGYEAVEGYMYNEPQNIRQETSPGVFLNPTALETTPSNYKYTAGSTLANTSTVTMFQQAGLNKIRAMGSDKWFGWTSDNWGGIQNIVNGSTGAVKWGAGFDLPFIDPLDRTFLDFHYYPDDYTVRNFAHSGTYGSIDGQAPFPHTNAQIGQHLESVYARLRAINDTRIASGKMPVPLTLSETGTPNNATWWPVLEYMLARTNAYGFGWFYFGIGEFFGNNQANIACDPMQRTNVTITDSNGNPQQVEVKALTFSEKRHEIVAKYLKD